MFRAYSKFSYRDLAAFAAEQRATQRVQAAPFQQAAPEPAAVRAAIFGQSGSKGAQDAKPASVVDVDFLFPTSIDQQGRDCQWLMFWLKAVSPTLCPWLPAGEQHCACAMSQQTHRHVPQRRWLGAFQAGVEQRWTEVAAYTTVDSSDGVFGSCDAHSQQTSVIQTVWLVYRPVVSLVVTSKVPCQIGLHAGQTAVL